MEREGAEMMGRTADDGTMGIPGLGKILAVRRIAGEIDRWASKNIVTVHVPVDSPAANFPICKRMKRKQARVVHLVAPQMWAWGEWRIRKLRRLTDHVMCLLPFEESWFRDRGVDATFVGHPVINGSHDRDRDASPWTVPVSGSPRVLLLPGSRTLEVDRNSGLLLEVIQAIQRDFPKATAVVVAANPIVANRFRAVVGELPPGVTMMTGVIDDAAKWCDFAIAVSGTVTLDLTRAGKPMIGVYRAGKLACLGANFMLKSPHRLLPNILARRHLVPEFVPWCGSSAPIIEVALRMAGDQRWRAEISDGLKRVVDSFAGHEPGIEAARVILQVARRSVIPPSNGT